MEFQYDGQRCRERIKCKPTPANVRKLTLFRDEIIESIAAGTFDYQATFPESNRFKVKAPLSDDQTIGHWLKVLLDRNEQTLKASSYATLTITAKKLDKAFGSLRLNEIKRRHVREYCEKLACGNRQIRKLVSALKQAIDCAVDDEVIDGNPIRDFSFKRIEPPKEDHVDPLTKDEVAVLLGSIDGPFKNFCQFAIWTGLRTSELVALEWCDIDFIRGVIRISKAKTQDARQAETTKTKSGTRDIKLLPPALEALQRQKPHTFMLARQVFMIDGKPFTGAVHVWREWKRALHRAGIRYRNPYQTRHTFASFMLSAGENINWLAKQMGHTKVTTTLQHYARFMPDENDQYGLKAVELFSSNI
ncbi:tyrosine-type recombinase/integrase [Methylomonas sp. HYX-M1]|uniref:tyrosine-type recombinase/integrase n=1 Tax=Methylomonas sp. HYX-M1 TaxID=3139307 RepID=UPI00345BCAEF